MIRLLARLIEEADLIGILARVLLDTNILELLPLALRAKLLDVEKTAQVVLGVALLVLGCA